MLCFLARFRDASRRNMRACEQDLKMLARRRRRRRTISLTFVIGAALAAVAGIMYLLYYGVIDFSSASSPASRLYRRVLGGIGSLPGACSAGS